MDDISGMKQESFHVFKHRVEKGRGRLSHPPLHPSVTGLLPLSLGWVGFLQRGDQMPPLNNQFQITLSYQQLKQTLQQLQGGKTEAIPTKRLSGLSYWMEGWLVAEPGQLEEKDKEEAPRSQQRPTYLSPSGCCVWGPGRPPVLSLSMVRLLWRSRSTHTSVFRL